MIAPVFIWVIRWQVIMTSATASERILKGSITKPRDLRVYVTTNLLLLFRKVVPVSRFSLLVSVYDWIRYWSVNRHSSGSSPCFSSSQDNGKPFGCVMAMFRLHTALANTKALRWTQYHGIVNWTKPNNCFSLFLLLLL